MSAPQLGSSDAGGKAKSIVNAISVDVEDYFHVRLFEPLIPRSTWNTFELRVERNTLRLLELFEDSDVRATFFVLGWVAERCPALVRSIQTAGHEIGSHGYSHRSVTELSPEAFRKEVRDTKQMLEDMTGAPILGFRAPSFSIVSDTLWAIDILVDEGFKYDSSVFPIVHDHYGIRKAPRFPWPIRNRENRTLLEFPMSTVRLLGVNVPFGGGGYLRQFPLAFTRWALRWVNKREQQPALVYLHPWEIDTAQPKVPASPLPRLRHYRNIDLTEKRLSVLLRDFDFAPLREVLGL